jgi:hypothetical protein
MSRLEVGVSCQHGAQRLQCLGQVALVGLGKLGQQHARHAVPWRGSRTRVTAGRCGGEAFDQPVALQRVHKAGDVAGGDAQLAAQVEQAPRPAKAERAQVRGGGT